MKKSYLISILAGLSLLYANPSNAQGGSLQFNQVLLLSSNASQVNALGAVPQGKVWKLESFGGNYQGNVSILLNGFRGGMLATNNSNYQGLYYNSTHLPVWLPEFTQLGFIGNSGSDLVWYSIIEFNVIP